MKKRRDSQGLLDVLAIAKDRLARFEEYELNEGLVPQRKDLLGYLRTGINCVADGLDSLMDAIDSDLDARESMRLIAEGIVILRQCNIRLRPKTAKKTR